MDKGFEERDELIDASAALVWEGGDEDFLVVLVRDEERIDEHGLVVMCEQIAR